MNSGLKEVGLEVNLAAEWLGTQLADPGLVVLVTKLVILELRNCLEALRTCFAFVRSLTSVNSHVILEVGQLSKSLVTAFSLKTSFGQWCVIVSSLTLNSGWKRASELSLFLCDIL